MMLSRVELETVQVSRLGQSREEGKESQRDELTTPEQPLFWETRTERPEITIPIIIINVRIVQNNPRTFLSLSLTNNMLLSGVMSVIRSKPFSIGTC